MIRQGRNISINSGKQQELFNNPIKSANYALTCKFWLAWMILDASVRARVGLTLREVISPIMHHGDVPD